MVRSAINQSHSEVEQIVDLYKWHGTIDAVLAALPLVSRATVVEVVNQIPNREGHKRRGTPSFKTRSELISDIQRARDLKGEPLSIPTYRVAAKELGLASYDTIVRGFQDAEYPWGAALQAAGVKANPPRGRRANTITPEQCIDAVAQCITFHGGRVSYQAYSNWASSTEGMPSGSTVRKVVGWSTAVDRALAICFRV